LSLPKYNSRSIQHAEVSKPDLNEFVSTKLAVRPADELQTDNHKTAVRVSEII
jgi:hypothetical protein